MFPVTSNPDQTELSSLWFFKTKIKIALILISLVGISLIGCGLTSCLESWTFFAGAALIAPLIIASIFASCAKKKEMDIEVDYRFQVVYDVNVQEFNHLLSQQKEEFSRCLNFRLFYEKNLPAYNEKTFSSFDGFMLVLIEHFYQNSLPLIIKDGKIFREILGVKVTENKSVALLMADPFQNIQYHYIFDLNGNCLNEKQIKSPKSWKILETSG